MSREYPRKGERGSVSNTMDWIGELGGPVLYGIDQWESGGAFPLLPLPRRKRIGSISQLRIKIRKKKKNKEQRIERSKSTWIRSHRMILCSCCTVSLCFAVVCRGYERTVADGPFFSVRATSTLLVPDVVDQSFLNTVTVRPKSTPTATPWARVTSRSPEWGGWLGRLSISKRSRIVYSNAVDPDRCSWRPTIAGTAVETRSSRW